MQNTVHLKQKFQSSSDRKSSQFHQHRFLITSKHVQDLSIPDQVNQLRVDNMF